MFTTTHLCGFVVLALALYNLQRQRALTSGAVISISRNSFSDEYANPTRTGRHLRVLLGVCIPVPTEWIEGYSFVSVESNCSNVTDEVDGVATNTGESNIDNHTDLMCVLGMGSTDAVMAWCLQEAEFHPERSIALVIPTAHTLPPTTNVKENVKLIPQSIPESPSFRKHNNDGSFENDVVLYLPCDRQPAELLSVAKAIPAYALKLQILEQQCSNVLLRHNGSAIIDTKSVMSKLFPLTNITRRSCTSVKDCLHPMKEAGHLVCLPSFLACLVLGFTSRRKVTFILNDQSSAIFSGSEFQSNVQVVSKPTSCLHVQGRVGRWGYNESYFKAHKYFDHQWIKPKRQFKDHRDRSCKYFWFDEYCPVSLMTKAKFCFAMEKRGFTRFFLLGDSLQYMAARSFLHQIGLSGFDVAINSHLRDPIQRAAQVIQCSQNFSLNVVLHRSNHLWPNYATNYTLGADALREAALGYVRAPNANRSSKMLEYFQGPHMMFPDEKGFLPWIYDYQNSSEKTLLWANVGSHFHHVDFFRQSVSHFESYLRTHPRQQDWVILQTVFPGHDNCSEEEEPYSSFSEYLAEGWTTTYDWNLFTDYNRILEELAFKARARDWNGPKLDLHDVYWMTALRKDGHPSAEDCLHYLLPGPPDFWMHTLYSMIVGSLPR